jgi:uncharacterized protein YyaL (SSP411 family)
LSGWSGAKKPSRKLSEEDKPVLLDIGAVWCHWCHVMDRESYENAATAEHHQRAFLSPVKVDRDERPDVDTRYQAAVSRHQRAGRLAADSVSHARGQAVTLEALIFLRTTAMGRPSFPRVLLTMAEAFQKAPRRGRRVGRQRDACNRAQRKLLRARGR